MQRLPDWEARLLEAVAAAETRPYAYGSWDCALAAAAFVEAQTGQDFGAPFRGKYRSAAGSIAALKNFGAGDLVSTFTAALGEPVAPLMAQRGDIVFDGAATGLMWVGHALFVGAEGERDGLVAVPLNKIKSAWLVGRDG